MRTPHIYQIRPSFFQHKHWAMISLCQTCSTYFWTTCETFSTNSSGGRGRTSTVRLELNLSLWGVSLSSDCTSEGANSCRDWEEGEGRYMTKSHWCTTRVRKETGPTPSEMMYRVEKGRRPEVQGNLLWHCWNTTLTLRPTKAWQEVENKCL